MPLRPCTAWREGASRPEWTYNIWELIHWYVSGPSGSDSRGRGLRGKGQEGPREPAGFVPVVRRLRRQGGEGLPPALRARVPAGLPLVRQHGPPLLLHLQGEPGGAGEDQEAHGLPRLPRLRAEEALRLTGRQADRCHEGAGLQPAGDRRGHGGRHQEHHRRELGEPDTLLPELHLRQGPHPRDALQGRGRGPGARGVRAPGVREGGDGVGPLSRGPGVQGAHARVGEAAPVPCPRGEEGRRRHRGLHLGRQQDPRPREGRGAHNLHLLRLLRRPKACPPPQR